MQLVKQMPKFSALSKRPAVYAVDGQVCMLGGSRDKWTKIVTNIRGLSVLGKSCDGSHRHAPWKFSFQEGFSSALEAEYPELMCQLMAEAICAHLGIKTKDTDLPADGAVLDDADEAVVKRNAYFPAGLAVLHDADEAIDKRNAHVPECVVVLHDTDEAVVKKARLSQQEVAHADSPATASTPEAANVEAPAPPKQLDALRVASGIQPRGRKWPQLVTE